MLENETRYFIATRGREGTAYPEYILGACPPGQIADPEFDCYHYRPGEANEFFDVAPSWSTLEEATEELELIVKRFPYKFHNKFVMYIKRIERRLYQRPMYTYIQDEVANVK